MDVRACPKCGSTSVSKSTESYEYSSVTRWACDDCDWHYKSGSGMGTASGDSGTHPSELTGTGDESGELCSECRTVTLGAHACTPTEIIEASDEDVLDQEDVLDAVGEFHSSPMDVLRDAARKREIAFTSPFFRVTEWEAKEERELSSDILEEPELLSDIREEIRQIVSEKEPSDNAYEYADTARRSKLLDRMAVRNEAERQHVFQCIDYLIRNDEEFANSTGGVQLRSSAE